MSDEKVIRQTATLRAPHARTDVPATREQGSFATMGKGRVQTSEQGRRHSVALGGTRTSPRRSGGGAGFSR